MLQRTQIAITILACSTLLLCAQAIHAGEEPPPCERPDAVIDFHLNGTENAPDADGFMLYIANDCEGNLVIEIDGLHEPGGVSIYTDGVLIDHTAPVDGSTRVERDTREDQVVPIVTEDSITRVYRTGTEILLLTTEDVPDPPCEHPDTAIDFELNATEHDPGAIGFVLYTVTDCQRRLVIEVGEIESTNGVDVFIDGVFAAFTWLEAGSGRIELNTSEGDTVPEVTEHSLIQVRRNDSDVVILTTEDVPDPPCEHDDAAIDFELNATEHDPGAIGFAIYTVNDCVRRLVIELDHITAGDVVYFVIDGQFIEDLPVVEGAARLELDTSDNHEVPIITEESVIQVFTGGELLILTTDAIEEPPPPCELEDQAIDFELSGTEHDPEAHGFVLYTVNHCDRRLIIELAGIASTDTVLIVIDGAFIASAPVVEGSARLDLGTWPGEEVPTITEHSVIEIFAAGTEVLILTSAEAEGISFAIDVHLIGTQDDPDAEGIAVYTVEGDVRRLVVEMAHIATANAVDIFIDGAFAGFTAVDDGFARLERDTSHGHSVPEVTEDSLIEVKRNDSNVVILTSHMVFVDFTNGDMHGSGGENDPLNTLGTAVDIVQDTGIIMLMPGATTESITIAKPLTLIRDGTSGTVIISGASRSSESTTQDGFISRPKN